MWFISQEIGSHTRRQASHACTHACTHTQTLLSLFHTFPLCLWISTCMLSSSIGGKWNGLVQDKLLEALGGGSIRSLLSTHSHTICTLELSTGSLTVGCDGFVMRIRINPASLPLTPTVLFSGVVSTLVTHFSFCPPAIIPLSCSPHYTIS